MLWVVRITVDLEYRAAVMCMIEEVPPACPSRCIERNHVIAAHQVGCFDQFFDGVGLG